MELTPVNSSIISAIGHDPDTNTLRVQFTRDKGKVSYDYRGVTSDDFAALRSAESIGKHFSANIRNNFPFTKVGV